MKVNYENLNCTTFLENGVNGVDKFGVIWPYRLKDHNVSVQKKSKFSNLHSKSEIPIIKHNPINNF